MRSIAPAHDALPEYIGDALPLNRAQLHQEFVEFGRRQLVAHVGPVLLPKLKTAVEHVESIGNVSSCIDPETLQAFSDKMMVALEKYSPEGGHTPVTA